MKVRKLALGFDNVDGLLPLPIQPSSLTMITYPDSGENADASGFEDGNEINEWRFGDIENQDYVTLKKFCGLLVAKSAEVTVLDYDDNLLPAVRNAIIIRPTLPNNARYEKGLFRDVVFTLTLFPLN